jgi:hypothetical protein
MGLYPASERQVSYLRSLIEGREWPERLGDRDAAVARVGDGTLDGVTASRWIDALRAEPKRIATKSVGALTVGMYRTSDGTIYRVHESRESGRLYAKRLVWNLATDAKPRFEYDRGAIYSLSQDDRMTLDEARAWGVETGACCVCGAFLTDAKSVARGIGPVCEGRV